MYIYVHIHVHTPRAHAASGFLNRGAACTVMKVAMHVNYNPGPDVNERVGNTACTTGNC